MKLLDDPSIVLMKEIKHAIYWFLQSFPSWNLYLDRWQRVALEVYSSIFVSSTFFVKWLGYKAELFIEILNSIRLILKIIMSHNTILGVYMFR